MSSNTTRPAAARLPRVRRGAVELLIATRKGAFRLKGDAERKTWSLRGPWMLGQIIQHVVLDPRDKKTMLLAARPGHLGPSLFRSTDKGKTWIEASSPPAFPKAKKGQTGRVVRSNFWLCPGHASEPGVWYAGTSPPALFRSEDGGDTWKSVKGFNDHKDYAKWTRPEDPAPPDGATLHSITVDPNDPRHLFVGVSVGGIFESEDAGKSWRPLNLGCQMEFSPGDEREYGHDPHCFAQHPVDGMRLWQQNHCGVYRMDRGDADRWVRVGDHMPRAIGDIGFPIVLHPRNPDTAWVFPMDGTSVWPRVSPGGKPAVYRTKDAGESWQRQDRGFPASQGWWTVKRQCMAQDGHDKVGLYLGTTSGEIWASRDAGARWRCIARHLPHVYAVEVAGVVQ